MAALSRVSDCDKKMTLGVQKCVVLLSSLYDIVVFVCSLAHPDMGSLLLQFARVRSLVNEIEVLF